MLMAGQEDFTQPLGLFIGPRYPPAPSTRLRVPPTSARLSAKLRSPTQPSIRRWWPRLLRTGALGLAEAARLVENLPDRTVKIWDVEQQRLLWTLSGHKETSVHDASSCFKAGCLGWDRRPATAYCPWLEEIKFRLWSLSKDEVAACRSLAKCSKEIVPRHVRRHPQLLWAVAFAPGGRLVAACHGAVGQSPTVVLYDAESGMVVRRLGRHKDTPLALAFSPSGDVLASAGMDRRVLLYSASDPSNDLPQGDADDEEERLQWLQDVEDFRREQKSLNASKLAQLAQELANLQNRSKTNTGGKGPWTPHPASGMVALL
ncbi:tupA [Symbiodinium sp. CCMP2592]|nr:tupA [Symbiodinium sp. CCMP2592]